MRENMKILIAGANNQSKINELFDYMKEYEYTIDLVDGSYETILNRIMETQPDMVISDICIKGGDGITLLQTCKRRTGINSLFVFITDVTSQMIIDLAYSTGCDYYFMNNQDVKFVARILERILSVGYLQKQERLQRDSMTSEQRQFLFESELEKDVTKLIRELGIPAHIKGYQYIREGIIMSVKDPDMLNYITKFLYPTIGHKYKTTTSSVERAIRHAIEVAWNRGKLECMDEIFGYNTNSLKGKPTNSEFIALLADKFRLEYRLKGYEFAQISA